MLDDFNIGSEETIFLPDTIISPWFSPSLESVDNQYIMDSFHPNICYSPSYSLESWQSKYASPSLDSYSLTPSTPNLDPYSLTPSTPNLDSYSLTPSTPNLDLYSLTPYTPNLNAHSLTPPAPSLVDSHSLKTSLMSIDPYSLKVSLLSYSLTTTAPNLGSCSLTKPASQPTQKPKSVAIKGVERNSPKDSKKNSTSTKGNDLREWAQNHIQNNEKRLKNLSEEEKTALKLEHSRVRSQNYRNRQIGQLHKIEENIEYLKSKLSVLKLEMATLASFPAAREASQNITVSQRVSSNDKMTAPKKQLNRQQVEKKNKKQTLFPYYEKMHKQTMRAIPNKQIYYEDQWAQMMQRVPAQPSCFTHSCFSKGYRSLPLFGRQNKSLLKSK